jgi:hypothetical protein
VEVEAEAEAEVEAEADALLDDDCAATPALAEAAAGNSRDVASRAPPTAAATPAAAGSPAARVTLTDRNKGQPLFRRSSPGRTHTRTLIIPGPECLGHLITSQKATDRASRVTSQ